MLGLGKYIEPMELFPIGEIRKSIEQNYNGLYYLVRLNGNVSEKVAKKINRISKGKVIKLTPREIEQLSLRLSKSNRSVIQGEILYSIIDNFIYEYKLDMESYFNSRNYKFNDLVHGYKFNLNQVYMMSQDSFNKLRILGKENDINVITKLVDNSNTIKLIEVKQNK